MGSCLTCPNQGCPVVGYHARPRLSYWLDNKPSTYYFSTNIDEPYCGQKNRRLVKGREEVGEDGEDREDREKGEKKREENMRETAISYLRFLSGKQYAIQLKMAPHSPPASFAGQLLIRLNGAHGSSQFISLYK